MREVRIQQKDEVTHTIFMVGKDGPVFESDNYWIAQQWMDEGLLCELSEITMREIAELRKKGRRV